MKEINAKILIESNKPYFDMDEIELRAIANYRYKQYSNACYRLDVLGYYNALNQVNNYMEKYAKIIKIMFKKGFNLSEKEKSLIGLVATI